MASKLRIYSLGIVTADKEASSWEIEAYPIEVLPTVSGDFSETEKIESTATNMVGEKVSISLEKSSTITAEWLPLGNYNRVSAPDVCRGETVVLFRYAGEDKFYWIPLYSEVDLRKRETVMYFFSNKDKAVDNRDDLQKNGYYLLADTVGKRFQLHTSDNDEEAAAYDIIVDTNEGKITIQDNVENSVVFDSVNKTYTITFGEKIEYISNKEMVLNAEETIDVTAQNTITITSNDKLSVNFKGVEISCGSYELITVLEELLDAIMDERHIGNLGSPTSMDPGSKALFNNIKSKISKFKG